MKLSRFARFALAMQLMASLAVCDNAHCLAPPSRYQTDTRDWKEKFEEYLRDEKTYAQAYALAWAHYPNHEDLELFYEGIFRQKGFLSNNPGLLRELAMLYMGSGKLHEAAIVLTHLQHFAGRRDYERVLGKTFAHLKNGDAQAAMLRLNQNRWPGSVLYWLYSGHMLLHEGENKRKDAEMCFVEALRIDPTNVHAWRLLALAMERQGETAKAEKIREMIAGGPPLRMDAAQAEAFLKALAGMPKTQAPLPAAAKPAPPQKAPVPSSVTPAMQPAMVRDYYDTGETSLGVVFNVELSGRLLVDRTEGPAQITVDGLPVAGGKAKKDIQELLPGTGAAYSYGNYLHNDWFVIFDGASGRVYHRLGEPVFRRVYSMVVAWKDGRVTSENVSFSPAGPGKAVRVHVRESKQDRAQDIRYAFFGQRLIREGKPVALQSLHYQFDDLFHLYLIPQFIDRRGDRPVYGEAIGWKELFVALPFPGRPVDRGFLWRVMAKDGLMELDLMPYLSRHTLDDIKQHALQSRGYREKPDPGPLAEGEYRIYKNRLEIRLIKSRYPHNLIGITRSGRLVMINVLGDKTKEIGMTISELQRAVMEKTAQDGDPVQDVFLLANSIDVIKVQDGHVIAEQSAARANTRQSALIVLKDKGPVQQKIPGLEAAGLFASSL